MGKLCLKIFLPLHTLSGPWMIIWQFESLSHVSFLLKVKSLSRVLSANLWTVSRDFPGKSTGVGCHFLLQDIFPTQGSNPGLLHCRRTLYHLSHEGSPSPYVTHNFDDVMTDMQAEETLLLSWIGFLWLFSGLLGGTGFSPVQFVVISCFVLKFLWCYVLTSLTWQDVCLISWVSFSSMHSFKFCVNLPSTPTVPPTHTQMLLLWKESQKLLLFFFFCPSI